MVTTWLKRTPDKLERQLKPMILTILTEDKTYSLVSYNVLRNCVHKGEDLHGVQKRGTQRVATQHSVHMHTLVHTHTHTHTLWINSTVNKWNTYSPLPERSGRTIGSGGHRHSDYQRDRQYSVLDVSFLKT